MITPILPKLILGCALFLVVVVLWEIKHLRAETNRNIKWTSIDDGDPSVTKKKVAAVFCYEEKSYAKSLPMLDSANVEVGRSIFFHETSCFNNKSGAILNARQACAVESAAKMNPNMTIYLLFLSPAKLSDESKILHDQLIRYKNVKIRRILVKEYFKGTPLEDWLSLENIKAANWPNIQMADIIRYVTLWKYGGIYMDLDVVVMRSLENLVNFAGMQDSDNIAAGVIGMSNKGFGHDLATKCLLELKSNFNPDIWGYNSVGVITRTLQKMCTAQSALWWLPWRKSQNYESCKNFHVFPPPIFYPIPYPNWSEYFNEDKLESTMQLLKDAKAIHVWNKLSKDTKIRVGTKVPYGVVAQQYCPMIYSHCGPTF